MLVSWNWLKEYVALDMDRAELENRWSMSGLNHEETNSLGDDFCINLEVTSNRPDWLGHIGVAREVAVLYDKPLQVADPRPATASTKVADLCRVALQCPELCYRYTARVIRGVKVGPSPEWLVKRLAAIGETSVNNIVDITNYVLFECGQPLHAFDLNKLAGSEIIVRESRQGETFEAINHKTYTLEPGMCVIADANRPVALGGVMGGADTEVSTATTDLLIEAAEFAALAIRTTARKLNLHSPSSYRFERGVDPVGVDWASRRCCELILEIAGGELADGVIDVGRGIPEQAPVVLRLHQLKRILGIDIPVDEVRRILTALGCTEQSGDANQLTVVPPSWRRDLPREIDLVEEVARIYGYEKIPEDVGVPMAPSNRSDADRVQQKVRAALTAAGFDEALTTSFVTQRWSALFSPWTDAPPLKATTTMLKGADCLRRTLVPSLLDVRKTNESLSNPDIELFETAHIYLPVAGQLPREQWTLGMTSGRDFYHVKGVIEAMVAAVSPSAILIVEATRQPLLEEEQSCALRLGEKRFGFIGSVNAAGLKQFGLRADTVVAELDLSVLAEMAELIPQYAEQSPYPAMSRDMNLIVDETVRWMDLANTVRASSGEWLEGVQYLDTYRDPQKKDGEGKKRLLFSISLRSFERTLTGEEADQVRDKVVAACHKEFGAVLLG